MYTTSPSKGCQILFRWFDRNLLYIWQILVIYLTETYYIFDRFFSGTLTESFHTFDRFLLYIWQKLVIYLTDSFPKVCPEKKTKAKIYIFYNFDDYIVLNFYSYLFSYYTTYGYAVHDNKSARAPRQQELKNNFCCHICFNGIIFFYNEIQVSFSMKCTCYLICHKQH